MNTLSDLSPESEPPRGIPPREELERIATACSTLDDAVVALRTQADALNVAWSQMRRQLADRVVWLINTDSEYEVPPLIRTALGGNFAEGALWQSAISEGLLSTSKAGVKPTETEVGKGIIAAIERALA